MSRGNENEEEEGGLTGHALVETAWKAFQAARQGLSAAVPDWSELDDSYLIPFTMASQSIRQYILEAESLPEDKPATFTDAAASGLAAFMSAAGMEADVPIDDTLKIAFEATARHITNALAYDAEDHGDLTEHESAWEEWARNQAAKRKESN